MLVNYCVIGSGKKRLFVVAHKRASLYNHLIGEDIFGESSELLIDLANKKKDLGVICSLLGWAGFLILQHIYCDIVEDYRKTSVEIG